MVDSPESSNIYQAVNTLNYLREKHGDKYLEDHIIKLGQHTQAHSGSKNPIVQADEILALKKEMKSLRQAHALYANQHKEP